MRIQEHFIKETKLIITEKNAFEHIWLTEPKEKVDYEKNCFVKALQGKKKIFKKTRRMNNIFPSRGVNDIIEREEAYKKV